MIISSNEADKEYVIGIVTVGGFVYKYISKELYDMLDKELKEGEERRG